jgi:exodeoxyribonuclease VII small subunit
LTASRRIATVLAMAKQTKKSTGPAATGGDAAAPEPAAPEPAAPELAAPDFEEALAALESLVQEMESGDLSLEASLAAYERGVKLTRQCQAALAAADLKVKALMDDDTLQDLSMDPLDDD